MYSKMWAEGEAHRQELLTSTGEMLQELDEVRQFLENLAMDMEDEPASWAKSSIWDFLKDKAGKWGNP
jgi:predicted glycosyl hydrolase (DUF1957 family)